MCDRSAFGQEAERREERTGGERSDRVLREGGEAEKKPGL